jgi:hypothetical protein
MNAWLKSILKRPFFLITIALIATIHGVYTCMLVTRIESDAYGRHAFDLSVTAKWRYGYFVGHDGAFLVKTHNTPGTLPHFNPGSSDDKELFSAMSHKLETYPLRATLEALLYSFLVGYAFFLVPWLKNNFAPKSSVYRKMILSAGAIPALFWTLACFPLLCFGYGSSLFSTWEGPGALGYTVYSAPPYPGFITALPGETISYRPLLEMASCLPMFALEVTGLGRCLPDMTIGLIVWISGVLFYCVPVVLVTGITCLWVALEAKRSAKRN